MKVSDLIADAGTGMLSHTKLWQNIANAVATGAFGYEVYTGSATPDVWLIYLGVVGASTVLSKLLSLKYGGSIPGGEK